MIDPLAGLVVERGLCGPRHLLCPLAARGDPSACWVSRASANTIPESRLSCEWQQNAMPSLRLELRTFRL